jgi:hypothetical protein
MGVAQHHDAVSGTEKQEVAFDYAQRLSTGIDAAIVSIKLLKIKSICCFILPKSFLTALCTRLYIITIKDVHVSPLRVSSIKHTRNFYHEIVNHHQLHLNFSVN